MRNFIEILNSKLSNTKSTAAEPQNLITWNPVAKHKGQKKEVI